MILPIKWIFILFIILIFYITFSEPNILTVKYLKLESNELRGMKIVFASDFHMKPYELYRLKRIVRKINLQNPDIILLGGDYVNGHKKGSTLSIDKISGELSNLKSKYGTIAIMGNHDGWQGKKEVIEAFERAGITVLENANKNFDNITIAGLEDMQTANPDVKKALSGAFYPVIMLTHTPDMIESIPSSVELTLAGHTHGGQVVLHKPLIVPSKYGRKYAYGLSYNKNKKIFVSRGLGTSILPVRFNCFPEIVVIEFI